MRQLPLHVKILLGMAAGLVVGLILNALGEPLAVAQAGSPAVAAVFSFVANLNDFVGDLFLRGLRFIAVPIVVFSLIEGASSLNDIARLSRIGGRTVALYVGTTAVAISLGLVAANLLQPGTFLPQSVRDELAAQGAAEATTKLEAAVAPDVWQTLLDIVPANPFAALAEGNMLQVVFLSLAVGVALTLIPEDLSKPVTQLASAMTQAVIKLVHLLMATAPVAVFCLLVSVMARLGLDVLGALAVYGLAVVGGLGAMMFLVYPTVLRAFTGIPARRFFQAIVPAQLLAFSSSSSSATLPVTMECVTDRLGVDEEVASFAIPLGATINMDGTALYQGVAALFIGQLYGVDLTFADQLTIVLTATLASIGTAGVPGVGLIMLVIVLQSVGMPAEAMQGGIAIIFGIDRILDMCRTTTNVTGDCMVCAVVAHKEGALASEAEVLRRLAQAERTGLDENP